MRKACARHAKGMCKAYACNIWKQPYLAKDQTVKPRGTTQTRGLTERARCVASRRQRTLVGFASDTLYHICAHQFATSQSLLMGRREDMYIRWVAEKAVITLLVIIPTARSVIRLARAKLNPVMQVLRSGQGYGAGGSVDFGVDGSAFDSPACAGDVKKRRITRQGNTPIPPMARKEKV